MTSQHDKYLADFLAGRTDDIPAAELQFLREAKADSDADKTRKLIQEVKRREKAAKDKGELLPPRAFADYGDVLPENENPHALFAHRWLCKEGVAFIIAESGIGKSTFINQAAWNWAIGKAGLGPEPLRPLRIGIIQNEDDDDEMREFRRDLRRGFREIGWTDEEIEQADNGVFDESQNFAGLTGEAFVYMLKKVQAARNYDIIIINPLQGFTGFDISKNAELNHFLRNTENGLSAVCKDPHTPCGIIIVHHTNKPPTSARDLKQYGSEATIAYAGAGGAEIVNYSRAIIVIKRAKDDDAGVFKLIGAKRGKRIGWVNDDGKRISTRTIAYSDGYLFWRDAPKDAADTPKVGRTPKGNTEADGRALAEMLKAEPLTRMEIRTKAASMFGKNAGARAYNWLILVDKETHNPRFVDMGFVEGLNDAKHLCIGLTDAFKSISRNQNREFEFDGK